MRRFLFSPPGQQAMTDVYDEQRQTLLVRYPLPLLLALSLTGAVALVLAGFLGYGDDPAPVRAFFHDAWPLFLWLCGLLIVLQLSILRHPALRRGAVAACIVTAFALLLVGAWEYAALQPVQMLTNLVAPLADSNSAGRLPVYLVADFGILALFWGDAIRRWVSRLRAAKTALLPAHAPTFAEMICGDLIAGGVLALVLAWIFQPSVIAAMSDLLASAHVLDLAPQVHAAAPKACSLAVGACASAARQPLTLSFLDLALALIALSLGLFVLAISAMFSGLTALGGAGQFAGVEAGSETDRVSRHVLGTVGRALNRRFHIAIDNVGVALRLVAWPIMTGISVFSAATTARYLWRSLHANSDAHTCQTACAAWPQGLLQGWSYEALALAGLLVTVLTSVFAVALLVGSWRVVENTLRYLRVAGFIGLLTFWIFSLALSGLNGALNLLRVTARVPFPQPGLLTILSFGAMVAYGVVLLARQRKAQPVAVAVHPVAAPPAVALASAGEPGNAPVVRGIERQGV